MPEDPTLITESNMKLLKFFKTTLRSLTLFEWLLWAGSVAAILLAFFLTHGTDYLSLSASLLGATSLVLLAKGNVLGQILVIVFSVLYAIVSYTCAYYGEMITYLCMTLPTSAVSVFVWLRNSFRGDRTQIAINRLKKREYPVLALVATAVTVAFYFILRALGTNNLIVSTVSVLTSFFAAALALRRSPLYALAYALNDIVLIVLWVLATMEDISYLPVVVNFSVFLLNDFYGFVNWMRLRRKQTAAPTEEADKKVE